MDQFDIGIVKNEFVIVAHQLGSISTARASPACGEVDEVELWGFIEGAFFESMGSEPVGSAMEFLSEGLAGEGGIEGEALFGREFLGPGGEFGGRGVLAGSEEEEGEEGEKFHGFRGWRRGGLWLREVRFERVGRDLRVRG